MPLPSSGRLLPLTPLMDGPNGQNNHNDDNNEDNNATVQVILSELYQCSCTICRFLYAHCTVRNLLPPFCAAMGATLAVTFIWRYVKDNPEIQQYFSRFNPNAVEHILHPPPPDPSSSFFAWINPRNWFRTAT